MWSSEVSPQRRTAWCPGPETVTWHGKKDVADVVRRMTMTEGDGPGPGLTSQQGSSGQGRSRVGVRGGNERKGRCAAPALSGSEGAQARAEGRSGGARGNKPALGSDVRAPEP